MTPAFDSALLTQRVLDGLADGSVYALLALALVVVYRGSGHINFAQGEMGTVCAFAASTAALAGWPIWLAIGGAMALGFALGVAVERVIVSPLERRSASSVVVAVNALGIAVWGVDARRLESVFPSESDDFARILGTVVRWERLGIFTVMLALLGLLWLLFNRTSAGLAARAVAVNPDSAALAGIRVGTVLALGWGIAGAIGALSACLLAPQAGLTSSLMLGPLIFATAAALVGGLDSPVGAVVAGLGIGVLRALVIGYNDEVLGGWIGGDAVLSATLLLIVVVLLVRPSGLFGSVRVERV